MTKKKEDNPTHSLESAILDEKGREVLNPVPLVIDVGPRPLSLRDQIKRLIVEEGDFLSKDQGFESFEEADDFDVEDEIGDIPTSYTQMEPDPDMPKISKTEWDEFQEWKKTSEKSEEGATPGANAPTTSESDPGAQAEKK